MSTAFVEVEWSEVDIEDEELKSDYRCLYAYVEPSDRILYLGKADRHSVWQRVFAKDKARLYGELTELDSWEELTLLVGEIILEEGRRLSKQLLSDIESLLIQRVQPKCNIQSRKNRIERLGLEVHCVGDWPRNKWKFRDH